MEKNGTDIETTGKKNWKNEDIKKLLQLWSMKIGLDLLDELATFFLL